MTRQIFAKCSVAVQSLNNCVEVRGSYARPDCIETAHMLLQDHDDPRSLAAGVQRRFRVHGR